MTLAETYALASAVPLDRPTMPETFYPTEHPIEKTILIHAFAGGWMEQNGQKVPAFPAKAYDHYDEVISLLRSIVEPAGYRFLQIGGPGEPPVRGVESMVGKTTLYQCAYLVRRCALLIGNDSMWSHVRGANNGALIVPFGPTSAPHHPYWHDPAKTSLIESHRGGGKPSYASHEGPKTINWIPPEEIADAAMWHLAIPGGSKRHSLFIGDLYNQSLIEMVPNVVVDPRLPLSGPLIVRMDYAAADGASQTEAIGKLVRNLQLRKCVLFLNREVDPNLLGQFKPQIHSMRVEVDQMSADWIRAVKRFGIPTGFVSVEKDPAKLADLRLRLYDVMHPGGIDHHVEPTKDDFLSGAKRYLNKELDTALKVDSLSFKTRRLLLSDDKVYLSKAHWLAGKATPTPDQNSGTVIDSPDFWAGLHHQYIYTE